MDDNVPEEEDIAEAVLQIQLYRAGGLSGMRAEHLRMWLRAMTREERLDPGNWEKVVAIIKEDFRGGELVVSCACQTV